MSDSPAHKRSLRTLLIRPTRQLKLTLAMLSVGIMVTASLLGYLVLRVADVLKALDDTHPAAALLVRDWLEPALDVMIYSQAALWILSVFVGIWISHRIYGPVVPLVRQIRNLTAGDYSSRVTLRTGDDLEEIADALNELTTKLAGTKG